MEFCNYYSTMISNHRLDKDIQVYNKYTYDKDDNCIYCGEKDSIAFSDCSSIQVFTQKAIDWFNTVTSSRFNPSAEEKCLPSFPDRTKNAYKRNLIILCFSWRYYIYTSKLHDKLIGHFHDGVI